MPNNSDNKQEPTLSLDLDDLGLEATDIDSDSVESSISFSEPEGEFDSFTEEFQENESTLVIDQSLLGQLTEEEDDSFVQQAENAMNIESKDTSLDLPKLFIETHDQKGKVIEIPENSAIKIGRTQGDVQIPHRSVSALHCTFKNNHNVVSIRDNGSTNGTFLNGDKLLPKRMVLLESGDILSIGQVRVRLNIPEENENTEDNEQTVVASSLPEMPIQNKMDTPEFGGLDLDLEDLGVEPSVPLEAPLDATIDESNNSSVPEEDDEDDQSTVILSDINSVLNEEPLVENVNPDELDFSLDESVSTSSSLGLPELPGEVPEVPGELPELPDLPNSIEPSLDLESSDSPGPLELGDDLSVDAGPLELPSDLLESEADSEEELEIPQELDSPGLDLPEANSPDLTLSDIEIDQEPEPLIPEENDPTKLKSVSDLIEESEEIQETETIKVRKPVKKKKTVKEFKKPENSKKKNQKLKIKKSFNGDELTGIFTRLVCFLGDLLIGGAFYIIFGLSDELGGMIVDLERGYSPIIGLFPLELSKQYINIYLFASFQILISNLLLGVSFFQFLCGVRGDKNFLMNRLLGVLRSVVGIFTTPLLIADLPIIWKKPSLKELITFNFLNGGNPVQTIVMAVILFPPLLVMNIQFEFIKDFDYHNGFRVVNTKLRAPVRESRTLRTLNLNSIGLGAFELTEDQIAISSYDVELVKKKSFLRPKLSIYSKQYQNYVTLKSGKKAFLVRAIREISQKEEGFSVSYPSVFSLMNSSSVKENLPLKSTQEKSLLSFIKSSLELNLDDVIEESLNFNFNLKSQILFKRKFINEFKLPPNVGFEVIQFGKLKFLKFKAFDEKAKFRRSKDKSNVEYLLPLTYLGNPNIEISYGQGGKSDVFITDFFRNSFKSIIGMRSNDEFKENNIGGKSIDMIFETLHTEKDLSKFRENVFWYDNFVLREVKDNLNLIGKSEKLKIFFIDQLRGFEQMSKIISRKKGEDFKTVLDFSKISPLRQSLISGNLEEFLAPFNSGPIININNSETESIK